MQGSKRFRRAAIALGTSLAVGAGLVSTLGPTSGIASSHREAPLIAGDPQMDNTDVYAFVSPDRPDSVTLISNWIPFQEPAGGPNFYAFAPKAHYNIKIDNDHDAKADITIQWVFRNHYRTQATFLYNTGPVTSLDDENLNFYQTYDLRWIEDGKVRTLVNDAVAAPSRVGEASMPQYRKLRKEAIVKLEGGGRSFAGQADDPFMLDLRVFDLLYGADLSEVGDDTLAGFNVNTLAVQVPKRMLALGGNANKNPIIGVWSTGDRRKVQVQG
ncbi:MAG: DUF4331 domain-containing protein, partial [Actinobacteria bacterium]|nr:DUF4331 domain-containing protein [Actinomycetota bacterium]